MIILDRSGASGLQAADQRLSELGACRQPAYNLQSREATHLHYCIIGHQDLSPAVEVFLFLISWALSRLVPSVTHLGRLLLPCASALERIARRCCLSTVTIRRVLRGTSNFILLVQRLGFDARPLIYHMHPPASRSRCDVGMLGTALARGTHGTRGDRITALGFTDESLRIHLPASPTRS